MNIFLKVAADLHKKHNHMYDENLPYSFHLKLCTYTAEKFIKLITNENDRRVVLAAVAFHDVLENLPYSYGDLIIAIKSCFDDYPGISHTEKNEFATNVADIVFAVTNEKGKTRKDRASRKYYQGIRETKYATFIKLCDRIANVKYSLLFESSMLKKYQQEHADFLNQILPENTDIDYYSMIVYLDKLFNNEYN